MSERNVYNLSRWQECLSRDNATSDWIPPKNLHAHCEMHFICPCGTRHKKPFQAIWENGGAFCGPCSTKNNTEKGRATREASIPEHIKNQQKEEQLIKEKEECELRTKRDEIVNGRRELLDAESDDTRFTHPTITTHCANKKGEVYNIKTGKLVKGTSRPVYGYIRDAFKGKSYERHRFLCECWYNTLIDNKYQVDHIDTNPTNNIYSNLQILTRLEHGKKTANDNIGIRRTNTKTSSKRVVRIKINDDNTEGEMTTYESLKQAKEDNRIHVSSITKSIKSGEPFRGYLYEFEDEDNNEDELASFLKNTGAVEVKVIDKH